MITILKKFYHRCRARLFYKELANENARLRNKLAAIGRERPCPLPFKLDALNKPPAGFVPEEKYGALLAEYVEITKHL